MFAGEPAVWQVSVAKLADIKPLKERGCYHGMFHSDWITVGVLFFFLGYIIFNKDIGNLEHIQKRIICWPVREFLTLSNQEWLKELDVHCCCFLREYSTISVQCFKISYREERVRERERGEILR